MSATDSGLIHVEEYKAEIIPASAIGHRQKMIWDLMANTMEKGTDYGLTPGCKGKNSLFKPGSEKVLSMFQLSVDPLVEDLCPLGSPDPYAEYRVRVHVTVKDKTGRFVGKGVGECSSWEEKYKWRRAVNDQEFDYMKSQGPDMARVKFGVDWQSKKDYQIKQVRVPTADIANTVLKIGKKRGQIDATLTATAASAIFTQDLEDMPPEIAEEIASQETREEIKSERKRPQRKSEKTASQAEAKTDTKEEKPRDPDCITREQQGFLYTVSTKCKLTHDEVKAKLQAEFKGKDGKPLRSSSDMLKADFHKYLDSVDPKREYHRVE